MKPSTVSLCLRECVGLLDKYNVSDTNIFFRFESSPVVDKHDIICNRNYSEMFTHSSLYVTISLKCYA